MNMTLLWGNLSAPAVVGRCLILIAPRSPASYCALVPLLRDALRPNHQIAPPKSTKGKNNRQYEGEIPIERNTTA